MRGWTVGIIGGGPGGLFTAYQLRKVADVPLRITVFEATDRLGGKILTRRFDSLPAKYEAGAAEFYDYSPIDEDPLRQLVEELGLTANPMGGSAVVLDRRLLAHQDDVREQLGDDAWRAWMEFDRRARDAMSPRDFYDADEADLASVGAATPDFAAWLERNPSPAARRYVETLIHSDLATEPARTNVSYGLQNYVMNHPAYMRLYSIDGGNERLPRELERRTRAEWRLRTRATGVERQADGRLRVTAESERGESFEDFDFVILALPNSLLPKVRFGGERLAEALRRHHSHYDHPAHYLRITLLFDRPFWRSRLGESYCMLDAFGGCCLYDESSREPEAEHGVLGWLLGGEAAVAAQELADDELIARALDSIPPFLAHEPRRLLEGRVHRWIGAVSALPGGATPRSLERRHRPEPLEHRNLFTVGDYLFDSTLNGVLDSATYVAHEIAAETAARRADAAGGTST